MTTEPHHHHHQEGNNSFGEDDDNDDVLMASLSFHARDGAFRESLIIRMTCAAAAEKKIVVVNNLAARSRFSSVVSLHFTCPTLSFSFSSSIRTTPKVA